MLVRGSSLAVTMSDYLIRQIERTPSIRVRLNTQVLRAAGTHHLGALTVEDTLTRTSETLPAAALFVLIGAGPHTGWLADTVQRDERGYILTGRNVSRATGRVPAWP